MGLQAIANISVDFYDRRYILINTKQLDKKTRFLSVTCYSHGDICHFNSSEHSAYIRYKKSDGHSVFNFCEINNKGKILVELTEQMLAMAGVCYADLVITNKGSAVVDKDSGEIVTINNAGILSTMPFYIDVFETAFENSIVESSYEYDGLNSLIERAEADYEEVVTTSKSWAIGGTGTRDGENTNNSKYWSTQSKNSANASNTSALAAAESERLSKSYMNNALQYKNNAETYMNNSKDNMNKSQSYAVGGTGTRSGENTDNSKYYSQMSKSYAVGNTGISSRNNENVDNAEYYSRLAKSYTMGSFDGSTGTRNNESSENAKTYMDTSLSNAIASQRYAIGGTNTVSGEDTDNAKYYYEQCIILANDADNSETDAETAQGLAETAQSKAEEAQRLAETAQVKAETAQGLAETAQSKAETAQGLAEAAASTAALQAAQNAVENVTVMMEDYVFNASTSETNAKESESNALISETNALNSARESKSYAVGGTGTRDMEDTDNAKYYYEQSSIKASNALDSEVSAKESENASKASEQNAKISEQNASVSEINANESETNALTNANRAQSYTVGGTGTRDGEDTDNARYYYDEVLSVYNRLGNPFTAKGTVYFQELESIKETAIVGYVYNIKDDFVTDETFMEGAGVSYSAGTNVYLTNDGYWDCFSGATVFGIKGENETSYRKGNVSLSSEDIGAISINSIATVDEVKEYLEI